jgi:5-methylcytosine-specific restriction endonuclease McrA
MKKLSLIITLILFSLCSFSQSRHISVTTKRIVFARDGGSCRCCGSSLDLEYDHITPFSCGGKNDASNIQLLCQKCNRSKSNSCYCKVHDKKVGRDCCDGKSSNTKSASTSTRCIGTTQKGLRCKRMTLSSNGRCSSH